MNLGNIYTVLIVDDSAFARKVLKSFLAEAANKLGVRIDVIEGKNGAEAVELYDIYRPGLVFMDIIMPKKNGLEALKEIIEKHKYAKIIICSSMGQRGYINEAIRLGCMDFIVKPLNDKLSIIEQILKMIK